MPLRPPHAKCFRHAPAAHRARGTQCRAPRSPCSAATHITAVNNLLLWCSRRAFRRSQTCCASSSPSSPSSPRPRAPRSSTRTSAAGRRSSTSRRRPRSASSISTSGAGSAEVVGLASQLNRQARDEHRDEHHDALVVNVEYREKPRRACARSGGMSSTRRPPRGPLKLRSRYVEGRRSKVKSKVKLPSRRCGVGAGLLPAYRGRECSYVCELCAACMFVFARLVRAPGCARAIARRVVECQGEMPTSLSAGRLCRCGRHTSALRGRRRAGARRTQVAEIERACGRDRLAVRQPRRRENRATIQAHAPAKTMVLLPKVAPNPAVSRGMAGAVAFTDYACASAMRTVPRTSYEVGRAVGRRRRRRARVGVRPRPPAGAVVLGRASDVWGRRAVLPLCFGRVGRRLRARRRRGGARLGRAALPLAAAGRAGEAVHDGDEGGRLRRDAAGAPLEALARLGAAGAFGYAVGLWLGGRLADRGQHLLLSGLCTASFVVLAPAVALLLPETRPAAAPAADANGADANGAAAAAAPPPPPPAAGAAWRDPRCGRLLLATALPEVALLMQVGVSVRCSRALSAGARRRWACSRRPPG